MCMQTAELGNAWQYLHMCEVGPGSRAGVELPQQDPKGIGICSLHDSNTVTSQVMHLEEHGRESKNEQVCQQRMVAWLTAQ